VTVPLRPTTITPVGLASLASAVGAEAPSADVEVAGITHRSGSVQPGDLYAALPGAHTHGSHFIDEAAERGAVAVLTDPAGRPAAVARGLPVLVVPDPRRVLGQVSRTVYGAPAEALTLIGVTGTQGKTTTTHLIGQSLAAAGVRTAVVGTLGTFVAGEQVKTALTTPEAPDLHALFAVMRERRVQVCAMEVSSHALVLGRVDGVRFDVAVFLNLGRDHLDFHGDQEHYLAAKASLFTPERAKRGVLNADDPAVAGIRDGLRIPIRTFSSTGGPADWRATEVTVGVDGARFDLVDPAGGRMPVSTMLSGDFNVANALAALAAEGEAGLDLPAAVEGLATIRTVPGRLEPIDAGQPFRVVVDYAHKPDAVTAALTALRPSTTGRLWIVLGAGGDRDHGKRELMGAAAARLADVVVVTDDNPRSEDPALIRAALVSGAAEVAGAKVVDVAGRREAIEHALYGAAPGDTVLIAGKGHETGQEIAGTIVDFDDRVVAREVLADRRGR
jgi:UDP-N-acetylmuramoyl-L-alanyl-D-glutamate--2,6-diaminopimelate ligase